MNTKKKLERAMARAITDFGMIEDGDRILCAVSGGKDSYAHARAPHGARASRAGAVHA